MPDTKDSDLTQAETRCESSINDGSGFHSYRCTRPAKGVLANGKWACRQHLAGEKRSKAASDTFYAKQREDDARQDSAKALAAALGMGQPHWSSISRTHTGGITLTAEEAQRLITWVDGLERSLASSDPTFDGDAFRATIIARLNPDA